MIRKILNFITIVPMLALLVSVSVPTPASAACSGRFFTLPTWHDGLSQGANCDVVIDELSDFWVIVLNVLEAGFQIIAYFAVGYIIWGGFKYIKSEGNSAKVGEAKQTILYAIIGLGVALSSVALVSFVSGLFQTS